MSNRNKLGDARHTIGTVFSEDVIAILADFAALHENLVIAPDRSSASFSMEAMALVEFALRGSQQLEEADLIAAEADDFASMILCDNASDQPAWAQALHLKEEKS
jgi:hypothetical protein